jgi:hypothetical protein
MTVAQPLWLKNCVVIGKLGYQWLRVQSVVFVAFWLVVLVVSVIILVFPFVAFQV